MASCGLAGRLAGTEDDSILEVSEAACRQCCSTFEPSAEVLNSVAASVLHVVGERIVSRRGIEGCDATEARRLMEFAAEHLPVLGVRPSGDGAAREPYAGTCFYLGEGRGTRPCLSCTGSVRQKVFGCLHEDHDETVILECRQCADYDRALPVGGGAVKSWAVGVVGAPRDDPTLARSLESLAAAGWPDPEVFVEPKTPVPDSVGEWRLTRRSRPLGAWSNWLLSLQELVLRYPRADAFLICQDDVVYSRELRSYLEATLWPEPRVGVVSLHTASHQDRGDRSGYYRADLGWLAWGAQAYVFSNPGVRSFLRSPVVVNHRHRGPHNGHVNIDSMVGQWAKQSDLGYYLHTPSPTDHIGVTSAIWSGGGTTGRRRAGTFPGENAAVDPGMDAPRTAEASPPTDGCPAVWERAGHDGSDWWESMRFTIVSPLVGRQEPFGRWRDWLMEAEMPPRTRLSLVDNSADAAFHRQLVETVHRIGETLQFHEIYLRRGPGPASRIRGVSMAKHRSVAAGYNVGLRDDDADLVLVLDCDTIPPREGLRALVTGFQKLASDGRRPGCVSGMCESAIEKGMLAVSKSPVGWRKRVMVGELAKDEVSEVGIVGTACLLIDGPALRHIGGFDASHMSGVTGPDGALCEELRRHGRTIWLHGGVACDHLF